MPQLAHINADLSPAEIISALKAAALSPSSLSPAAAAAAAILPLPQLSRILGLISNQNDLQDQYEQTNPQIDMQKLIELSAALISAHPKRPGLWAFRSFLLARSSSPAIISTERSLVTAAASSVHANYPAWEYRLSLITNPPTYLQHELADHSGNSANHNLLEDLLDELFQTLSWSKIHVADVSGWHYRATLLNRIASSDPETHFPASIASEFGLARNCIAFHDTFEALWVHLKAITRIASSHPKIFLIEPNLPSPADLSSRIAASVHPSFTQLQTPSSHYTIHVPNQDFIDANQNSRIDKLSLMSELDWACQVLSAKPPDTTWALLHIRFLAMEFMSVDHLRAVETTLVSCGVSRPYFFRLQPTRSSQQST